MLPDRYTLSNLTSALRDREKILREIVRINGKFNHKRRHATEVMEEDWDNLIILDGCRHDSFIERNKIQPCIESSAISLGSTSLEFLERNFAGKSFHDTVYVSSNPFLPSLEKGIFHSVANLLEDCWDPELGTVPPAEVVAAAQRTREKFPNKRLIIHFMQPHFPFIGERGQEISQRGHVRDPADFERMPPSVWIRLQRGELSTKEVRDAYHENLVIVLEHVEELINSVPGLHIITADHGNLIGDRTYPIPVRGYGHPRSAFVQPLIKVPWASTQNGDRRETTTDPPENQEMIEHNVHQDRLRALGYVP